MTTPQPITSNDTTLATRSPIGTRYEDGLTLVAYSVDPFTNYHYAMPLFIADEDIAKPLTHPYDLIAHGSIQVYELPDVISDGETLELDEPDEEKTAAALAAYANRTEPGLRDTRDFTRVTLHGDLDSDAEVAAFIAYGKAELKLRAAQHAMERASATRAETIAQLVDLKGSQPKAAKTLGLNQSTISRALRERRPEQP
ncbi:hypothetical protein [Streptomyces zhihengii]